MSYNHTRLVRKNYLFTSEFKLSQPLISYNETETKLCMSTELITMGSMTEEEQMLKQSICSTLTRLFSTHLPIFVSHCKSCGCSMSLCYRMIAQVLDFSYVCGLESRSR